MRWVSLVLLVSHLPAEAFIWQRRHDLALLLLAQAPSILWLAVWTVGGRRLARLLQRWTHHQGEGSGKE